MTAYKDILERIAATKRREVEAMKSVIPSDTMRMLAHSRARTPMAFDDALRSRSIAVIAEHKRRSPSRGEISPMSQVAEVARIYAGAGASAMSVLTDAPFFGGSPEDLAVARIAAPELPLLRKDFIVDPWQIYQARALGADALLLIAAMLDADTLHAFHYAVRQLGMQALIEIHSPEEARMIPTDATVVGINNRNLRDFTTDLDHSARMVDVLPAHVVKVAESGISSPQDIARLKKAGFDAFLIGEALMKSPSPAHTLREYVNVKPTT